ncbi:hypothetical protein [Pseudonocardia asaccharolytica]|uniref:Uncharacterized protein n=1 Tax=Pseudonocardia asaccharolytica DSM 44247 = NBRC 16224 TaxID=1123024 RepID=A0A511CYT0_9PSEU|nr:hypothetical protein [Pseudonocardia asaccharolytica]GEL17701.1 hypothetical protein PA7_15380 [Pseudonocardia asaccharolytica DSM 44247 = NBRC 16224]
MRVRYGRLHATLLVLGGMALAGYEAVAVPEPRMAILGLAAAMMGLPGAVLGDRLMARILGGQKPEPSPDQKPEAP